MRRGGDGRDGPEGDGAAGQADVVRRGGSAHCTRLSSTFPSPAAPDKIIIIVINIINIIVMIICLYLLFLSDFFHFKLSPTFLKKTRSNLSQGCLSLLPLLVSVPGRQVQLGQRLKPKLTFTNKNFNVASSFLSNLPKLSNSDKNVKIK